MTIAASLTLRVVSVFFLLGLSSSETGFSYTPNATNEAVERPSQISPPWKLKGPSDSARVYIDSSGSIRGFVGSGAGPHARLLRRLKDILVESQVLNLEAAQFGLKVHPAVKVPSFQKFGTDQSIYGEGDTYLAGAIDDALSWQRDGVVVVLTDGVSSVTKSLAPKSGPSARRCDLGSDTACLTLRISEYIRKGHGFWIVGFRLPFDGSYWVEEGGPKATPGVKLERVKVPDRPFYVWVGARDVAQGRAIVRGLMQFAQGAKPSISVMSLEVAPALWEHWDIPSDAILDEIERPKRDFCVGGGALVRSFLAREGDAGFAGMEVSTRAKGSFAVRLPLRDIGAFGDLQVTGMLPLLHYRQELALESNPRLNPQSISIKWLLQPYGGSSKNRWRSLDLCVTGQPPQGLLGKDIDIVARWKGGRAITTDAPWDTWSTDTDDTSEAVRRTVNLSLFFRHLLAQLIPEFGEKESPAPPSETILRIRYRK